MAGALPNIGSGAVVTRNLAGETISVSGVANPLTAHESFVSNCEFTSLPTSCTANISPEQINGIVAELVNLAAAIRPQGPWRCSSTSNLGDLFTSWADNLFNVDGETIQGDGSRLDPFHAVGVTAVVSNDPPETNENPAITTTFFGANDARLGGPVRWIKFTIPGVTGVVTVPSYT